MTDSFVTSGIVLANTLAIVTMATTELNPFLEYVQNGASVGAIMGIFLWREMKRAERYEKLYDQERINRQAAEAKCSSCPFVRQANEGLSTRRIVNRREKMQNKKLKDACAGVRTHI